jgi:transposase
MNMVKNGEFFMIKEMRKNGMYITQIADELGRDPKTVRKWLKEEVPTEYKRTNNKPRKLDPYKDYVMQRMKEGCINSVVILDEIKAMGYSGGITILRGFMHQYRPIVNSKVTERFETSPGKQAQVDWGQFTVDWEGKKKRIYAFVMVLGYSRMMYAEFTEDEKLDTLMECHLRAMEYFGGITETCLYDNMKTVVKGVDEKGELIFNNRFASFASHHGFIPRRCRPYRARTKGKVESGVKYIKKNFWPRVTSFTGMHDLNTQVQTWLNNVANKRVHGTTHEIPEERWKVEKLKSMNTIPFEILFTYSRKVSNDLFVSYEGNMYSVPVEYAGHTIQIRDQKNGIIHLYNETGQLIAQHTKSTGKHQVIKDKKHFEGLRTADDKTVPQPMPKLVQTPTPEVTERPLRAYDELAS